MHLPALASDSYAILVTGSAASQLDAAPRNTRARIFDELATLAEAAARLESSSIAPALHPDRSELCISDGGLLRRFQVDHAAQRVRLLELRKL